MSVDRHESPRKANLERILVKAVLDKDFKRLLISNPSAALSNQDLSAKERGLLERLSRDELEEIGVDVRPYRQLLRTDGHKC